jgi:nucleotide-binding universal stress UspA family protein
MRVAKRFDAHLTAIYGLDTIVVLKHLMKENSPQLKGLVDRAYALANEAEARIRALAEREGVSLDWDMGEGDPAEILSLAGRLHDLVVIGQTAPGDTGSDLAAWMTTTADRPTLVVPNAGPFLEVGRRILVAWNGTAQAAEAVLRAMPFLETAEHVSLLVGENREVFPRNFRLPRVDVSAYLRRHGVEATQMETTASNAEAGGTILDVARAEQADLIVMGAYGRSRFREWIFGGATRDVLAHMHVPVLMAR